MERLFTEFSRVGGEGRPRLPASLSVNTTAERLFELAGGSGSFRALLLDLKLCNQE